MKVFDIKDMPEDVRRNFEDELGYFDTGWREDWHPDLAFIKYKITTTPSPEMGNLPVYNSKWFIENGAIKGEEVLVNIIGE